MKKSMAGEESQEEERKKSKIKIEPRKKRTRIYASPTKDEGGGGSE